MNIEAKQLLDTLFQDSSSGLASTASGCYCVGGFSVGVG